MFRHKRADNKWQRQREMTTATNSIHLPSSLALVRTAQPNERHTTQVKSHFCGCSTSCIDDDRNVFNVSSTSGHWIVFDSVVRVAFIRFCPKTIATIIMGRRDEAATAANRWERNMYHRRYNIRDLVFREKFEYRRAQPHTQSTGQYRSSSLDMRNKCSFWDFFFLHSKHQRHCSRTHPLWPSEHSVAGIPSDAQVKKQIIFNVTAWKNRRFSFSSLLTGCQWFMCLSLNFFVDLRRWRERNRCEKKIKFIFLSTFRIQY